MRKIIIYFSTIISVFLLSFFLHQANAVEIQGGDSFDGAAELTEGTYQGEELSEEGEEADYYYIEIEPGQEISITDNVKPASEMYGTNHELFIYDDQENEITSGMGDAITFSWAVNSEQSSYKYYIKVEDVGWGTESYTLKVDITEHYDANSQTDASDQFSNALSIEPGEYKGSLAYVWWQEQGLDTYDFYKINATAETPLTITLTPPSDGNFGLTIYDSQQKLIKDIYTDNAGEILTETFSVSKDDTIYIKASCEYCYDDGIYDYDLEISGTSSESAAVVETTDDEIAATTTTTTATSTDKESNNWLLIGIIIGLVLLLFIAVIVIIIVIIVKKKKQA